MLPIRILGRAFAVVLVALLLATGSAFASAGALDSSFGNSGTVITGFSATDLFIHSIAIDSQGRIVAVGQSGNEFAVARYEPNGSLDPTFGSGGIVTTSFGGISAIGYSVAIDSSGRIVVAGASDNGSEWDEAVARYLANGQLDSTFGGGGKQLTSIGTPYEFMHSVELALDHEGRIVLATPSYHDNIYEDFGVIRMSPNGQLDTSFGNGTGKVITALGSNFHDFDQVYDVKVDSADRIVVAGAYENDSDTGDYFVLLRYSGGGVLDSSFGAGGLVAIGGTAFGGFVSLAFDSQQHIVAAGGPGVARFNTNGTLDASFGSGGVVTTTAPPIPHQVLIDGSGRIVVAGETVSGGQTDEFALARYLSTGAPDMTFGTNGAVTTSIGPSDYAFAYSAVIDAQGRIVLGGGTYDIQDGLNSFALARYLGAAAPSTQQLTVTKTGSGTVTSLPTGIDCGATCAANFTTGTHVVLSATPAPGSSFAGWSGAGCSGTGTCAVTMDSAKAVTATFAAVPPSCTLSVRSAKVLLPSRGRKPGRRTGTLTLSARCDQAATASLTGTLTELAAGHRKSFRLGPLHGSLQRGAPMTFTLRLPAAALGALARGAHEAVSFTLTATNANGTGRASARASHVTAGR